MTTRKKTSLSDGRIRECEQGAKIIVFVEAKRKADDLPGRIFLIIHHK